MLSIKQQREPTGPQRQNTTLLVASLQLPMLELTATAQARLITVSMRNCCQYILRTNNCNDPLPESS